MNPLETKPNIEPGIGLQNWFKRTGDSAFIRSDCVFTENQTLEIGSIYEIHDFTEPDVKLYYIKLLWVYLKGFSFHLIGVDITNGDLKLKSQRLNAPELPCNFLICDLLYFDESLVEKILRKIEDEDLLEFEFEGNE